MLFSLSSTSVTFERIRGERFAFSGAIESVSGSGTQATLTGIGTWNGAAGYSFEVSVVDNASWGRLADTISVVIRDPGGAVVFTSAGPQILKQGDISITPASSG